MKKLTTGILWAIGLAGTWLVGEGLLTGQELSDLQNVIGMILGGSAVSIGMVISILRAIPTVLTQKAYEFLVKKYGQTAVDNFVNKIDDVLDLNKANNELLTTIDNKLDEAKAQRQALLEE